MNLTVNQRVIRLTPALVETLPHYAGGMSYEDMREKFGISKSAIKKRCETLREVFGGQTRDEVTIAAIRTGFLSPTGNPTGQTFWANTQGGL